MRIVKSQDNSFTAYSEEFDECYHSLKDGALKESLKKHIEPAFNLINRDLDSIKILDICFGLGFNTFSTIYYIKKHNLNKKIEIISPEFDKELIDSLKNFPYPKEFESFKNIIDEISKNHFYKDENIKVDIKIGDAREVIKNIESKTIDIVYQDPFSPKKNPLLWTLEYFKEISRIMKDNGVLTTYSIATPVRIALYSCGFRVYEKEHKDIKKQTIASKTPLSLKEIDMKEKIKRSKKKALKDIDFVKSKML